MKILSLIFSLSLFISLKTYAQDQLPTVDYSKTDPSQVQRGTASTGQSSEFLQQLNQMQGQSGGNGLSAADQKQLLQQLKQFKEQEKERQELLEELMAEP
ncbi:hypothetical protein N9N67_01435 [Bacteriovoracaceae bacterium]|nr:hypothetical protein [Bacteriovoracaceae bacterium]